MYKSPQYLKPKTNKTTKLYFNLIPEVILTFFYCFYFFP